MMQMLRRPSWPVMLLVLMLSGCYSVDYDTAEEWCGHMSGKDLANEQAPLWGVIPVVSFEKDQVRDELTWMLDSLHMEKVEHRADRMAWREGTTLHLESLATLMVVEPDSIVAGWKAGINRANRRETIAYPEECLFTLVNSLFDEVHIHYSPHNGTWYLDEQVTVIETDPSAEGAVE